MKALSSLVQQLSTFIPQYENSNEAISSANVGWQIEHSLLTVNIIVDALAASNVNEYKFSFKPFKYVFKLTGNLPRGKVRAPKRVQPQAEITTASLQKHIEATLQKIESLSNLTSTNFFPHPYFGNLKLKEAIWFLKLHTKHHLSIVKDIVKA